MMSKIKDLPKSTEGVDRDYGLDLSQYKNMMEKVKSASDNGESDSSSYNMPDLSGISSDEQIIYDSYGNALKPKKDPDYSQVKDIYDITAVDFFHDMEYNTGNETKFDKALRLAMQELVLGDYNPDETTKAGTAARIAAGFSGIDLPADIRDLVYDITHKDSIPDYKKRIFSIFWHSLQ
jgi:hypothetical protein